jgi:hypothetical protein
VHEGSKSKWQGTCDVLRLLGLHLEINHTCKFKAPLGQIVCCLSLAENKT